MGHGLKSTRCTKKKRRQESQEIQNY